MNQDTIQTAVQSMGIVIAFVVIGAGMLQLIRRKRGSQPMAGNHQKNGMREE